MKKLLLPALLIAALLATAAPPPAPALAEIKSAAENGDPVAQDRLGDAFRNRFDTVQAEVWYRKAAAQGVVNSQYNLGHILLRRAERLAVTPASRTTNGDEAIKWLHVAANQGNAHAQAEFSRLLQEGKLLNQDYVEAYKWSALAAQGGPFDSAAVMGRSRRDALILKMAPGQVAEGQRRAEAFVPHQPGKAEIPEPTFLRDLKLKGISGAPNRRLALINNQTFQTGDELPVKVAAHTVSVRCQAITEASVVIAVAGLDGTRELKLSDP